MKARNILKKISLFGLILIISVILLSCTGPPASIEYDSVEELQKAWPEYYYFDIAMEDFEIAMENLLFQHATVFSRENRKGIFKNDDLSKYNYTGYVVGYYIVLEPEPDKRAANIGFFANKLDLETLSYSHVLIDDSYEIDGINCSLYYHSLDYSNNTGRVNYDYRLRFMLDEIGYEFMFSEVFVKDDSNEEKTAEYVLAIFEPAVKNRYKGVKN